MVQVTFHDLFPTADVVAQVSTAHAALRARADQRADGACLSVTLTHRDDAESTPYRVLIEWVEQQGSRITAATEAYDARAALRSGLSVTDIEPLRVSRVELVQSECEQVANDHAPSYELTHEHRVA
jgi:hypothetical protein